MLAKTMITPRMLEEAQQAAQKALDAFVQPEEVRPGQRLCCRGRVTRAVHIAGQQPREKWEQLHTEINRLAAIADQRFQMWLAAERAYRDLCKEAAMEPELSQGETCTCEGCQIEEQNTNSVQNPQDHRKPLPEHLWQRFAAFDEARTVQLAYKNEYLTSLRFDPDKGDFVLAAN